MRVSEELLEQSICTLWDSGATVEEVMELFHLRRKRVQELILSGVKRGLLF